MKIHSLHPEDYDWQQEMPVCNTYEEQGYEDTESFEPYVDENLGDQEEE